MATNILDQINQGFQNTMMNPMFQVGLGLMDGQTFNQAIPEGTQRASGLQQVAQQKQQQELQLKQQQALEEEKQRKLQDMEAKRAFQAQFAGQLGLGSLGESGYLDPTQALATEKALKPQAPATLKKSDLVQIIGEGGQPQWVTAEQSIGREAVGKSPLVTVGGDTNKFKEEREKGAAKQFSTVQGDALNAERRLNDIMDVEKALEQGAYTGKGAGIYTMVNEVANMFGLPADLDAISSRKQLEAKINKMGIEATKGLKGAVSEKELNLAIKSLFDKNSPEQAIRDSLQILKGLSQLRVDLGSAADKLANEGRYVKEWNSTRRVTMKDYRKSFKSNRLKTQQQSQTTEDDPLGIL